MESFENEGGLVGKAKMQVSDLAQQVKEQTVTMAEEAREQVKDAVEQQRHRAADRVGSIATALRDSAVSLRRDDEQTLVTYAERAAERVDKVSNYLRQRDLGEMIEDLGAFARRRPELFLAGSFVAGILAARFLKSSSGGHRAPGSPASRASETSR